MKNWGMPIPENGFRPPIYQCRRAKKAFVLDGNVEKEFWKEAEFTELFQDIEGEKGEKPYFTTRAKMLWDDENLYFGAILDGNEIWGTLTEHDSVIFNDNDFEIFIDPDSDTHQYFEYEMNVLQTVWDLFLTKPYRDYGGRPLNGWDIHGLRRAVKVDGVINDPSADNLRWMLEVVMPFAALKEMAEDAHSPLAGDYYRINFSRVQWDVDVVDGQYKKCIQEETGQCYPEHNWVWAPTGVVNIHYPELWGFVFFCEGEEKYSVPAKEYTSWKLRCLYYLEHRFRDQNGYFTDQIEDLQTGDSPMEMSCGTEIRQLLCEEAFRIQVSDHGFEISSMCKSDQVNVTIFADGKVIMEPIVIS